MLQGSSFFASSKNSSANKVAFTFVEHLSYFGDSDNKASVSDNKINIDIEEMVVWLILTSDDPKIPMPLNPAALRKYVEKVEAKKEGGRLEVDRIVEEISRRQEIIPRTNRNMFRGRGRGGRSF